MDRRSNASNFTEMKEDPGISLLFSVQWEEYGVLFMLVSFLAAVAFLLLLLNDTILHKLVEKVPQSVLLIVLGLLFAATMPMDYPFHVITDQISALTFIKYLLPPIILDSAYKLYCKTFLLNLDGILCLALLGTALNIVFIGLSLYGAYGMSNDLSVLECLLLAAALAAVDPVAVLTVFRQIGVKRSLYILILGESLLNDGVTVAAFDALKRMAYVDTVDSTYAYATLTFVPVGLGGALIGVMYGAVSAVACKCVTSEDKVLEPTLIILSAYMSFLNAQLFQWSGILALIACGLMQKKYAFQNICQKSRVTVETSTAMLATVAETTIFLILGFKVLDVDVTWDLKLMGWSLLFCIVYRFIITFLIGCAINMYRVHPLSFRHMIIMSYGGLRGSVSFAMVASLGEEKVRSVFLGAALAVIMVTVVLQGSTIQLVVKAMQRRENIPTKTEVSAVMHEVNVHLIEGMEAILGDGGNRIHCLKEKMARMDSNVLLPLLCVNRAPGLHALELRRRLMLHADYNIGGALDYARKRIDEMAGE